MARGRDRERTAAGRRRHPGGTPPWPAPRPSRPPRRSCPTSAWRCSTSTWAGCSARSRARTGLDLDRDLLDWAGDAALFVRGTSKRDVSGALVIRASDPSLARRSITKIAGAVRRFGHQPVRPETIEGAQGFSVAKPGAPRALVMLERGDEVIVAYGADSARAALAPSARLDSDPAFRSARGALAGGFSPSLYVAVAPILQLARSSGAGASPGFQRAAPYLDAYRFLVAGGRREGGTTHSRLVVGLR